MSADPANPQWSSSLSFYLATVGASVGLGSIWRFPYLAGSSGGSAFILVFVIACLLIATPLLAAEFLIGRSAQRSPPQAAGRVARAAGLSPAWNIIGVFGTVCAYLVISYYTVIAGWVMAYTWKCASGGLNGLTHPQVAALWREFLSDPVRMGAWHAAFVSLVAWISARGVHRGLEIANKVRAPVMLSLLLLLAAYALWHGDARRGLAFAFSPNVAALNAAVILSAIGQAFYATGVGMAMMLAYGSYLRRGTSLVRSSVIITASILLVSMLATVTVFPLVFRYGMDPAQGVDLVFGVLASVFAEMPGGQLFGSLFFLLLIFAALTPSLAGSEPVTAWLQQNRGWTRARAAAATGILMWVSGLASVLSFNRWAAFYPLDALPGFHGKTVFAALDYVASNVLCPVGALLTSLFVGWRLPASIRADQFSETSAFAYRAVVLLLRFVCPVAIGAVFVANLY
jgi:NSS family neurotransmitter:Na+ symporter